MNLIDDCLSVSVLIFLSSVDELHANPDKALYALYFSRPHQYSEVTIDII